MILRTIIQDILHQNKYCGVDTSAWKPQSWRNCFATIRKQTWRT